MIKNIPCSTFNQVVLIKDKIYLSGHIAPNFTWRNRCPRLDNYEYINPEDWWDDNPEVLVSKDIEEIEKCKIFFVYIPYPTTGTTMELMYAAMNGKNIIAVINKKCISPWHLFWLSRTNSIIVNTLKDGYKVLKSIGDKNETFG